MRSTAILLMAYGTAPALEEAAIRQFLRHVLQFYRRAEPSDEEVRDLQRRLESVGGSPLYGITDRIAVGVQNGLDVRSPGEFVVRTAMKHSPPFIEDVVCEIARLGVTEAVGVALAPFRSRLSTDSYYQLVHKGAQRSAVSVYWDFVPDWNLHPLLLGLWRSRVKDTLESLSGDATVVFTNHSLPSRITELNDPYPSQFAETAKAIADGCSLPDWTMAYQSAGGGGEPWLGPFMEDVLQKKISQGRRNLVIAPIGFLMDHLEELYDVDAVAKGVADDAGAALVRTPMPNDDPLFIEMLIDVILQTVRRDQVQLDMGLNTE